MPEPRLAGDTSTTPISGGNKYATSIGDGTHTTYVVTHNLGTQDVVVQLYDNNKPNAFVQNAEVQNTSPNTITIIFGTAPTANRYTVVIIG
jgi:hypothetical protein